MSLIARQAATTTLFGSDPSQTYPASQGSINLYTDKQCNSPLSQQSTPLILSQCQNTPFSGIYSVEISSLPTCVDSGTPLLIVSNEPNCRNSTVGSGADNGVINKCLAYSSGEQIGSMQFVCYGEGLPTSKGGLTTARRRGSLTLMVIAAMAFMGFVVW